MLFNSFAFAIFLPVVFALYWLIPQKFRWIVLLAASCYFYMSWNAKYIILILITIVISYVCALLIEKYGRYKKPLLVLALVVCFGILFFFKYFNFAFDSINAVFEKLSIPVHPITLKVMLPVGISFYTFQTLSYVIDVYKGDCGAEKHFGVYATFISFFPQLVAGPIERSVNLLPQIKAAHKFDYAKASYGMKLMAWGFFKKIVIADNLSAMADKVYDQVTDFSGFALILATLFFTIQIYCDFSGYSDIARGCAKLFGIDLMVNFKSPYFSDSIRDFWSRWHISLSTWFRDYVYIPLGGNRVKPLRKHLNNIITFLVSGLWHGANWTFVIWGGIHGLAQVVENILGINKKGRKKPLFIKILSTVIVFCFVAFAWVFFRAQTIADAGYVIAHSFTGISEPAAYFQNGLLALGIEYRDLAKYLLLFILPLAVFDGFSKKRDVIEWLGERNTVVRHLAYALILLLILFFHATGEVAFVYFQF